MSTSVLERMAAPSSAAQLWRTAVGAFRSEGFVAGSYDLIRGTSYAPVMRSIAFGYPDDLVSTYHSLDYSRLDIAARRCIATGQVLTWGEAWSAGPISREEQEFHDRLTSVANLNALAVPCFGPKQRIGYVSLLAADPARTFSNRERRKLQALAQVGHLRLCELLFAQASEFTLSPREREILHWVAQGKSNSVIAQLVNCSANTVDTHLRRAYAKMDVSDRTTAAIKAIGLGLIT